DCVAPADPAGGVVQATAVPVDEPPGRVGDELAGRRDPVLQRHDGTVAVHSAPVGDERIARYAYLLVGTCIDVQPGWEVVVVGSPPGKPLLQEVGKAI